MHRLPLPKAFSGVSKGHSLFYGMSLPKEEITLFYTVFFIVQGCIVTLLELFKSLPVVPHCPIRFRCILDLSKKCHFLELLSFSVVRISLTLASA